jgi:hypothetical protein
MSEINELKLIPIHGEGLPVSNMMVYGRGLVAYKYGGNKMLVVDVKNKTSYIDDEENEEAEKNVVRLPEDSKTLKHAVARFDELFKPIGGSHR